MRKIDSKEEAARCLLCENAPCNAACKAGDPAGVIGISKRILKK